MGKKSKRKKLVDHAAMFGHVTQVAALPYRLGKDGMEILVITSRRRKRLIIPKGWPMIGISHASAAAIEADEEAGVKGEITSAPFGSFDYFKHIGSEQIRVNASVFPIEVRKLKSFWKERKQRKRTWLSVDQAAVRLDNGGLRSIVRQYADSVSSGATIGNADPS